MDNNKEDMNMDITDATDEPGRSNGERTYDIIVIIPDGRTRNNKSMMTTV